MLADGLVLGLGLANKHSVGLFAAALVTGVFLADGRRLVLNRWFAAGAVIAAAFTIPDVWWQAQHQWATIAMTRALAQENGGLGNIASWVIGQLIMTTLALAAVWVAGLRFLSRSGRPLWRALAWAYAILFVFFVLTTGGKIYYLAGAYIYLLGAGAVAIDGWLAARAGRLRRLLLATAVTTALAVPVVLPVLPAGEVLDPEDQPGTGRVRGLAAAGQHGSHRVVLTAGQAAGQRGDLRIELRRGQRDQRATARNGPPAGREQPQHLLVVGPR